MRDERPHQAFRPMPTDRAGITNASDGQTGLTLRRWQRSRTVFRDDTEFVMSLTFQSFASHRRDRRARPIAVSARAGTVLALAVFAAGTMMWLEFGDRFHADRAARATAGVESSQPARLGREASVGDPATRVPDALRDAADTDPAPADLVTFGG